MTTTYIDVGGGKWGVLLCYDYYSVDYNDMWAVMRSFGMSDKKSKKALEVLSHLNSGMTVSNYDIRMSAVFISDTTSESEWWSTVNHELLHVGSAIIDYYGEEYDGEPAAYLQGYLMKMVVEKIGTPRN